MPPKIHRGPPALAARLGRRLPHHPRRAASARLLAALARGPSGAAYVAPSPNPRASSSGARSPASAPSRMPPRLTRPPASPRAWCRTAPAASRTSWSTPALLPQLLARWSPRRRNRPIARRLSAGPTPAYASSAASLFTAAQLAPAGIPRSSSAATTRRNSRPDCFARSAAASCSSEPRSTPPRGGAGIIAGIFRAGTARPAPQAPGTAPDLPGLAAGIFAARRTPNAARPLRPHPRIASTSRILPRPPACSSRSGSAGSSSRACLPVTGSRPVSSSHSPRRAGSTSSSPTTARSRSATAATSRAVARSSSSTPTRAPRGVDHTSHSTPGNAARRSPSTRRTSGATTRRQSPDSSRRAPTYPSRPPPADDAAARSSRSPTPCPASTSTSTSRVPPCPLRLTPRSPASASLSTPSRGAHRRCTHRVARRSCALGAPRRSGSHAGPTRPSAYPLAPRSVTPSASRYAGTSAPSRSRGGRRCTPPSSAGCAGAKSAEPVPRCKIDETPLRVLPTASPSSLRESSGTCRFLLISAGNADRARCVLQRSRAQSFGIG